MHVQRVMVLKTPQGAPNGCVRLRQEADGCLLTVQAGGPGERIFCFSQSNAGAELHPDAQGEARLAQEPAAIVVLDEQGCVRAMGGKNEWARRAAATAQQMLRREQAGADGGAARTQTEPAQDEPAARACAAPETQPDEAAETLPAPGSAWPPPPFFPDARFRSGTWQA